MPPFPSLFDADNAGHVVGLVEAASNHGVGWLQAGGDPFGVPVVEHGVDCGGKVGAVPGRDDHEPVTQTEDRPVQGAVLGPNTYTARSGCAKLISDSAPRRNSTATGTAVPSKASNGWSAWRSCTSW